MKIAEWRNLIAEQRSSGLSVRRFCEERGVSDSSFGYWRKKTAEVATGFARVDSGGLIAVELPGGKTVRIGRNDLPALLEALCGV